MMALGGPKGITTMMPTAYALANFDSTNTEGPWAVKELAKMSVEKLHTMHAQAEWQRGKAISTLAGPSDVQYWTGKRTACYMLLRHHNAI